MRAARHSISPHATRMSYRRRAFAMIVCFGWPVCAGAQVAPPPAHADSAYFAELRGGREIRSYARAQARVRHSSCRRCARADAERIERAQRE